MNIHPILVHFPIALMTIYAVAELIRLQAIKDLASWFYIKAFMLIVGTASSFLALSTGEVAEHLADRSLKPLIEVHSAFASASTWIFGFLSVVYLISVINKSTYNQKLIESNLSKAWIILTNISNWVLSSYLLIILALAGLIVITITGALGGAIVYGPDVDPIVRFTYNLFF